MAFPTTGFLDQFNRANGPIGANWLAAFGDTIPAINASAAKGGAAGWFGAVWAPSGSVASIGPDCEAYYTISNADASAQSAMVLARVQNPTSGTLYNGYACRIVSGVPQIGRFASAAYTPLATGASITLAANDKLGIECAGNIIRLYYAPAGVWPGAATVTYDTTPDATKYTAAGAIAVDWNQTGANTNGMDDFGGGTLSGVIDKPVADSGTVSEVATPAADQARPDTGAVTDTAVVDTGTVAKTAVDSAAVTDASSPAAAAAATDSGVVGETSTVTAQTAGVEGTLTEAALIAQDRADAAAVTDTAAVATGTDKTAVDAGTVSDAVSALQAAAAAGDTGALVEAAATLIAALARADTATLGESALVSTDTAKTAVEAAALAEAAAVTATITASDSALEAELAAIIAQLAAVDQTQLTDLTLPRQAVIFAPIGGGRVRAASSGYVASASAGTLSQRGVSIGG